MVAKSRKRALISDDDLPGRRTVTSRHGHVAEMYGEGATLGLKDWARRSVLAAAPKR